MKSKCNSCLHNSVCNSVYKYFNSIQQDLEILEILKKSLTIKEKLENDK